MKTYKIFKEDIKLFMSKLFVQNAFDDFEVRLLDINSFANFKIETNLSKNEDNSVYWEKIKPYGFNIIKGSVLPKCIKIIFNVKKEEIENISDKLASGFLNVTYENDEVLFTTGTSTKEFTLDKMHEELFEEYIKNFFELFEIPALDMDKL